MGSTVSANISQVAAKAVPNPQPNGASPANQPLAPDQVIRASQNSAQQDLSSVRKNEKKRAIQIPKRSEGSYSPQSKKKRPGPKFSATEEEQQPSEQFPESLDILA
ncbi:MAG: hypothetical protein KDD42_04645 [Bdellovibrionales bacterium]|nr:hypothetical protein [Bdellovibrionales bacterium]